MPTQDLLAAALGPHGTHADLCVFSRHRIVATARTPGTERSLLFSISKTLTAVTVMALTDADALTIDTRIADLVPGFGVRGKEDVTVEDVLSHRGGFPDRELRIADFENRARAREIICGTPRRPELTGRATYHVLGFSILADVVEHAAGAPFEEVCSRLVLAPLGMHRTSWGLPGPLRASAPALTGPAAGAWDVAPIRTSVIAAANAWSTAADVTKLMRMLACEGELDGARILPERAARSLLEPHAAARGQAGAAAFGLGVLLGTEPGFASGRGRAASTRSFGHAGATAAQAWYDPADDIGAVVLTNGCDDDQDAADRRWCAFADELRSSPAPI